jgi:antagonist of KipI
MDIFAFYAANALAGNPGGEAVIEIGLGDVSFRATRDCLIAVTGAGYRLSIFVWEFPLWGSFFVRAGWKIHLNKTHDGMWSYLAVHGGLRTEPELGSRSTYLRGALGGLKGGPLQPGDNIGTNRPPRFSAELAGRTLPEEDRPAYTQTPTLDVIPGPQTDYFSAGSIETFLSSEYSISLTSDRMGYRLEGPSLLQRGETELISEGLAFGVIQIPPHGQPIVMMADGPTTGGYPKIATVASADLPLLAQCMPIRSRIRFQETTVETAQQKYRELIKGLVRIVEDE